MDITNYRLKELKKDKIFEVLNSNDINKMQQLLKSDYDVNKTFCPARSEINFYGFKDVIDSGKIVVLNMNIAKFKNLSKVIAAYLKLDFHILK